MRCAHSVEQNVSELTDNNSVEHVQKEHCVQWHYFWGFQFYLDIFINRIGATQIVETNHGTIILTKKIKRVISYTTLFEFIIFYAILSINIDQKLNK